MPPPMEDLEGGDQGFKEICLSAPSVGSGEQRRHLEEDVEKFVVEALWTGPVRNLTPVLLGQKVGATVAYALEDLR